MSSIYPSSWKSVGIVSESEAIADASEMATSDDPHPEHYRWRRFTKFVHGSSVIEPALARSLYALGEQEEDLALGESIMSAIIRLEDCPRDLYEKASRSTSAHLQRVAATGLNRKDG